ncbi:MAG: hypothetical protein NVSMB44_09730 [Ktedonobacteraceae bacterium]
MQAQEPSLMTNSTTESPGDEPQEWRATLAPWWRAGLAVLPTFLLTRLLLLILTYFGGVLFSLPNNSSFALTLRTVFYSWYHWDTPRYLTIATQGYIDQSYTGFFPLYPTIVRTFATITHRDVLTIGILVANLSFFAALVVFYKLVEYEFERETAARGILYLAILPSALLSFAAYNTSTLLFLLLFCFYLLRRGRWWTAGLVGMLAALTDLMGILLFFVFICEFLRQYVAAPAQKVPDQPQQSQARLLSLLPLVPLLAALFIPLGLGIYSNALARKALDPLTFLHPQETSAALAPWTTLVALFKGVSGSSPYSFVGAHSVFELLSYILLLATLILCITGPVRFARNQWTFVVFGALILLYVLIFPSLPSGMQSLYDPMPALLPVSLTFFVGIVSAARLGKRAWFHTGYLMFSLPLLAFFLFQLFTGHWTI